ncbi:hypothetical protein ACOME3_010436 [Neoechinorhynchus agilis]
MQPQFDPNQIAGQYQSQVQQPQISNNLPINQYPNQQVSFFGQPRFVQAPQRAPIVPYRFAPQEQHHLYQSSQPQSQYWTQPIMFRPQNIQMRQQLLPPNPRNMDGLHRQARIRTINTLREMVPNYDLWIPNALEDMEQDIFDEKDNWVEYLTTTEEYARMIRATLEEETIHRGRSLNEEARGGNAQAEVIESGNSEVVNTSHPNTEQDSERQPLQQHQPQQIHLTEEMSLTQVRLQTINALGDMVRNDDLIVHTSPELVEEILFNEARNISEYVKISNEFMQNIRTNIEKRRRELLYSSETEGIYLPPEAVVIESGNSEVSIRNDQNSEQDSERQPLQQHQPQQIQQTEETCQIRAQTLNELRDLIVNSQYVLPYTPEDLEERIFNNARSWLEYITVADAYKCGLREIIESQRIDRRHLNLTTGNGDPSAIQAAELIDLGVSNINNPPTEQICQSRASVFSAENESTSTDLRESMGYKQLISMLLTIKKFISMTETRTIQGVDCEILTGARDIVKKLREGTSFDEESMERILDFFWTKLIPYMATKRIPYVGPRVNLTSAQNDYLIMYNTKRRQN